MPKRPSDPEVERAFQDVMHRRAIALAEGIDDRYGDGREEWQRRIRTDPEWQRLDADRRSYWVDA